MRTGKESWEHVATELGSKSFIVRMMNGWDKLPEEVVQMGSERQSKGKLENGWLAVFGEDTVLIEGLGRWSRGRHHINFSPNGVTDMSVGVTYNILTFTPETLGDSTVLSSKHRLIYEAVGLRT